jgi:hypothetical protein
MFVELSQAAVASLHAEVVADDDVEQQVSPKAPQLLQV